ncbi:hypothetical protein SDC9_129316 [bioreactor metagenome]|uniref:Uncharacterized protein n=1 Tax=bioreactor metagenome TaxID=1076179 RepID=A0A645CZF6_9ZZZZ
MFITAGESSLFIINIADKNIRLFLGFEITDRAVEVTDIVHVVIVKFDIVVADGTGQ